MQHVYIEQLSARAGVVIYSFSIPRLCRHSQLDDGGSNPPNARISLRAYFPAESAGSTADVAATTSTATP